MAILQEIDLLRYQGPRLGCTDIVHHNNLGMPEVNIPP